jgi:dienelactone hydrolase
VTAFDPAGLGTPSDPPTSTARSSETLDGVAVSDLSFAGAGFDPTDAYLVRPAQATAAQETSAQAAPAPGIIWFHWLEYGSPTSNRTEFLDEARALAGDGLVSLLVQGTLPWTHPPTSIAADVPAIEREVRMARSGVDLLAASADVDPDRLAAVGHDFGGMYLSLLFATDPRLRGLAVMAPTARWGDWFLPYWKIADPPDAYLAATARLDPVASLAAAAGRPLLLQFADHDEYVPAEVAAEMVAAAGPTAATRRYDAGHDLDVDESRVDRRNWLLGLLGAGAGT